LGMGNFQENKKGGGDSKQGRDSGGKKGYSKGQRRFLGKGRKPTPKKGCINQPSINEKR